MSVVMTLAMLLTGFLPGLVQKDEEITADACTIPSIYSQFDVIKITGSSVNIREGASTGKKVLTSVHSGTILRLADTSKTNGFYKIYYTGANGSGVKYGYVSADYAVYTVAKFSGFLEAKKVAFFRSDRDSSVFVSGSYSSPLTGLYPVYRVEYGGTNYICALYDIKGSSFSGITSTTSYKCALGLPIGVCGGSYTYRKIKTSGGIVNYSNKQLYTSKDSVNTRYYPSTSSSTGPMLVRNRNYELTSKVNFTDGTSWYSVKINGIIYWVRSDLASIR